MNLLKVFPLLQNNYRALLATILYVIVCRYFYSENLDVAIGIPPMKYVPKENAST